MREVKEIVTKLIDIEKLIPNSNNAKEHPEWQVDQIVKSIEKFGFNDPVAITEDMVIVEGHGRYLASQKLGLKKIPCFYITGLTEDEVRAYTIAHNKLTMNTGFDVDVLRYELNALNVEEFDLSVLGFTDEETEQYLNDVEDEPFDDIEELETYNEGYNITIVCENLDEAEELNEKLNLNLDLTKQVLKRKYKDLDL